MQTLEMGKNLKLRKLVLCKLLALKPNGSILYILKFVILPNIFTALCRFLLLLVILILLGLIFLFLRLLYFYC